MSEVLVKADKMQDDLYIAKTFVFRNQQIQSWKLSSGILSTQ